MRSFFLAMFLFASNSHAGQEGHGGDIAVSLFLGIAHKSLYCLAKIPSENLPSPTWTSEYEKAILTTHIYSAEKTELNGVEVDAINFPDIDNPRIIVNRSRWLRDELSDVMRSRLIIHEYLSIMGYEDKLYELSYPLVERNKQCLGGQL